MGEWGVILMLASELQVDLPSGEELGVWVTLSSGQTGGQARGACGIKGNVKCNRGKVC